MKDNMSEISGGVFKREYGYFQEINTTLGKAFGQFLKFFKLVVNYNDR